MTKVGLWSLYYSFFYCGLFTFGGGAAMLPLLQRTLVDQKQWINETELLDYYSVAQCTPGIIAINVATFVGEKTRGVIGAIVSTLGMITPSYVIITLLSTLISKFATNIYVLKAFAGIRIVVSALVLNSIINLFKGAKNKNTLFIILMLLAFVLKLLFNFSSIIMVLSAIVISFLWYFIASKRSEK